MTVLINGEEVDGRIPVTDSSVMRGDGCFEAVRLYEGVPFELDRHLARLERSANSLGIPLPRGAEIAEWVTSVGAGLDQSLVRVLVTRGSAIQVGATPRVVVFSHPIEPPSGAATLIPIVAPWHAPGWDLSGAKTLSYAPNMAARRSAIASGFDDALLISVDGVLLEGPTFAIGWIVEGRLETPTLELAVLDSITRQLVIEDANSAGVDVDEGEWEIERLGQASEVLIMSTVREVQPVAVIGDLVFEPGPVTAELRAAFSQRTGSGTSGHASMSAMPAHETSK